MTDLNTPSPSHHEQRTQEKKLPLNQSSRPSAKASSRAIGGCSPMLVLMPTASSACSCRSSSGMTLMAKAWATGSSYCHARKTVKGPTFARDCSSVEHGPCADSGCSKLCQVRRVHVEREHTAKQGKLGVVCWTGSHPQNCCSLHTPAACI